MIVELASILSNWFDGQTRGQAFVDMARRGLALVVLLAGSARQKGKRTQESAGECREWRWKK